MKKGFRRALALSIGWGLVHCGLGVDFARYTRGNPDGGVTVDGSGATDAGDASATFCDVRKSAAFCSEFTKPLAEEWTPLPKGGGSVDLIGTDFVSAPTALRAHVASAGPEAYVQHVLAGPSSYARLEFSYFPETVDTGSQARVAIAQLSIGSEAEPDRNDVRLYVRGDRSLYLEEFNPPSGYPSLLDLPAPSGKFIEIEIAVDVTTREGTLKVGGGGPNPFTITSGRWTPGTVRARLGVLFGIDSTSPWTIIHDDAAISLQR